MDDHAQDRLHGAFAKRLRTQRERSGLILNILRLALAGGDAAGDRYTWAPASPVAVRGKAEPVEVFAPTRFTQPLHATASPA